MSPKSLLYYSCFVVTLFVGVFCFFYFTFNIYLQFLGGAGGIVSATAIFLLFITNLPSFQKNIASILSSFNWIRKAELASIAYNIQGNINQFREVVNKESPDLIPEAEVDWVTETSRESFFDDFKGKVIVRMDPSKDNDKNLARAVMIQISKGVLPESRVYIEQNTSKAIDLALAKKILASTKQANSLRYFVSEILNPELADNKVLSTVETIDTIDSQGFFTRLYLRELGTLPNKIGMSFMFLSEVREETSRLLSFLEVIAKRKKGERVPLSFGGKFLKTAIVLVSEESKFWDKGVEPYALAAAQNVSQGSDLIYVLAWENKVEYAKEVVAFLQKNLKMTLVEGTDKTYFIIHEDQELETICATLLANKQ